MATRPAPSRCCRPRAPARRPHRPGTSVASVRRAFGRTYPRPMAGDTQVRFVLDGRDVTVDDDGASLLEVLRDRLAHHSPKDGCSPQGQCGCCTVLVDGSPRVACVTPVRRIAGRTITTVDGLEADDRERWTGAFLATGASQCGFCTPGIVCRLQGLRAK